MSSLGVRNNPIEGDVRNTRVSNKTGRGKPREPEPLPPKVHLFNSKKKEGEPPALEGVKVGFKRGEVVPLAVTQPKEPEPPLTRTSEPRPKPGPEPKLIATVMPKKGELLGRLKQPIKEPSEASPTKTFRKGDFGADIKIGEDPERPEEARSRGKAEKEGSALEDSVRATKTSNKFSMECRPLQRGNWPVGEAGWEEGEGKGVRLVECPPLGRHKTDNTRKNSEKVGVEESRGSESQSPGKKWQEGGTEKSRRGRREGEGRLDGRKPIQEEKNWEDNEDDGLDYVPKNGGEKGAEEGRTGRTGPGKDRRGGRDRQGDAWAGKGAPRKDESAEYVAKEGRSPGKGSGGGKAGRPLDLGGNIFKVL